MSKNVLITGAAKRIGAACARLLHDNGCNILIHYRSSEQDAKQLADELNARRGGTALPIQANLADMAELNSVAETAIHSWGGIDLLINNASSFYPTPLGKVTENQWDELLDSNLKAPFFLAMRLSDCLTKRRGCIINMVDIHAERGLAGHAVYCIAKAGLVAATKILAKELAPSVRVNGIAPGAILWPETSDIEQHAEEILSRIALARSGTPEDIAQAVLYLFKHAPYTTGQILTVDGGRTLNY